MQDLLALDVDVNGAACRPTPSATASTTSPTSQAFSPALMEGYLRAASRVTALAVGDPDARVDRSELPRAEDRVAAAPRRRRAARHARRHLGHAHVPGRRRLRRSASSCTATPRLPVRRRRAQASRSKCRSTASARRCSTIDPNMAEVTDQPVAEDAGRSTSPPARSASTAAFLQRFEGPVNDLIAPIEHTLADTQIGVAYGITTLPHLKDLDASSDRSTSPAFRDTPSRRNASSSAGRRRRPTKRPCAAKIVDARSRRRRSGVRSAEQDFDAPDALLSATGARSATSRPASPRRSRRFSPARSSCSGSSRRRGGTRPGAGGAAIERPATLASRLSFFLWAAAPDAELLTLADAAAG